MRTRGWLLAVPLLLAGQGDTARRPATPPAPAPTTTPASATPVSALARTQQRREAAKADHKYDDTFRRYSKRWFGAAFDWRWFKAQGMAESNLDSAATSWVGARGVMQLMPATYRAIQSRRPEFGAIDDPEWNIAAGIMHDRYLWRLWDGKVSQEERFAFMFASYNAGEGTIGRAADSARVVAGGPPAWLHVEQIAPKVPRWRYRETLGYVRKIDTNYTRLRRQR
ncbi:MAG: transglycosylase SLT domain-containing protein [Gemmatimonadetes bacterium]|nr:transglycosylase SLT domain-containing protein [Gemmatimonadota bacterium]